MNYLGLATFMVFVVWCLGEEDTDSKAEKTISSTDYFSPLAFKLICSIPNLIPRKRSNSKLPNFSIPPSLRVLLAITTVEEAKAPQHKLCFKSKISPGQILFLVLQTLNSPSPQSHQWDWSTSAAFGQKPKCVLHALVAHIAFSQLTFPQCWQVPAMPLPLNFKDNSKYQCFGLFFLQMSPYWSRHLKWKRWQDLSTLHWGIIPLLHPVKEGKLIVTHKWHNKLFVMNLSLIL